MMLKQQVKSLFDQLQDSYDELKDENEIAIMERYWIKTKLYTTAFTSKRIHIAIFSLKISYLTDSLSRYLFCVRIIYFEQLMLN